MAVPDNGPALTLLLRGPIDPRVVPALCARVCRLLEDSETKVVTCDVGELVAPDVVVVETLARFQLTARRLGRSIQLRHASDDLRSLIALVGLTDALPCCPAT